MSSAEELTMPGWESATLARVAALAVTSCLGSCANLDAASVGETHRLAAAEFYRDTGSGEHRAMGEAVLLPAGLDHELANVLGYGRREAEFAPLLAAIDADLAARACCRFLPDPALPAGAPHLYVGSATGEFAPPEGEQQVLPQDQFPPMVLHLQRPSPAWRLAIAELLAREGASHAVVVSLGVSQYPKGRRGVFDKQVTLGTGHVEPIRFLTAEDKLLEVLQLTGVLVDAEGQVIRAGAEGILARDTPFPAQVFEVTKMLDQRTLEQALTVERRADLPGNPLKWEVALSNLLAGLGTDPTEEPRLP
jgi:hypothetical protein